MAHIIRTHHANKEQKSSTNANIQYTNNNNTSSISPEDKAFKST